MYTYTTSRNLAAQLVNRTADSTVLTQMDGYINDSIRTIANMRGGTWKWLEDLFVIPTVAAQQSYEIPNYIRKVMDVYVKVGDTIYMPEAVYDQDRWKVVLAYRMGSSDVPRFYYVQGTKILFSPIPSTSGNLIYIRGRLNIKDMTLPDYTTGTITSVAKDGTSVIGNGTTWTKSMIGRYIRITETNAANGGDGFWYEIGDWVSATNIILKKPYQGTDIVAGTAAYVIGQVSPIPESYQIAPIYRAVALYWDNNGETERAKVWWLKYDGGYEAGYSKSAGGLIDQLLEEENNKVEGPYIPPFGSTSNVVNIGAWWSPWQGDASGF